MTEYMTSEEYRAKYGRSTPKTRRKRRATRKGHKDWVSQLLRQIEQAGLPAPRLEYKFHAQRRWRFDMDWKQHGYLVACEVEGGTWMQTKNGYSKGHGHPQRFRQDCEKYNEAALYGWAVIRVTPDMITDGRALDWLTRALDN